VIEISIHEIEAIQANFEKIVNEEKNTPRMPNTTEKTMENNMEGNVEGSMEVKVEEVIENSEVIAEDKEEINDTATAMDVDVDTTSVEMAADVTVDDTTAHDTVLSDAAHVDTVSSISTAVVVTTVSTSTMTDPTDTPIHQDIATSTTLPSSNTIDYPINNTNIEYSIAIHMSRLLQLLHVCNTYYISTGNHLPEQVEVFGKAILGMITPLEYWE
jgi:hypothetical protein